MGIQGEVSQVLSQLAEVLPFGYAYGAGMVSAVNPCGFAMLPVYLTLYLGADDGKFAAKPLWFRLAKSCWVATIVTAGFGLLFGLVGVLVSAGGSFLMEIMPWLSVVVALMLAVLGVYLLAGHSFSLPMFHRLAATIGDPRDISIGGFFIFGLAFGATSLSCTLPIFLLVVGGAVAAGDFATGILQFILYILGMGSIMLLLTVGIAVVKEGVVVGMLRRLLPYVEKISAIFLIAAGLYIAYYWYSSDLLF